MARFEMSPVIRMRLPARKPMVSPRVRKNRGGFSHAWVPCQLLPKEATRRDLGSLTGLALASGRGWGYNPIFRKKTAWADSSSPFFLLDRLLLRGAPGFICGAGAQGWSKPYAGHAG